MLLRAVLLNKYSSEGFDEMLNLQMIQNKELRVNQLGSRVRIIQSGTI